MDNTLSLECKPVTEEQKAIFPQPETEDTKGKKRSRKSLEVEIFDPSPSEATEAFIKVFQQKLKDDGIIVRKTAKISDNKTPVFLICNMSTRLETDIKRGLNSVREADFGRIVLIALHVKENHALPQQKTKYKLGTEEKYRDFKNIVDIAFTQENGLYDCHLNQTANDEIRRLYEEEKKKK